MGGMETIKQDVHLTKEEEALYQIALSKNSGLSRADFKTKREDLLKNMNTKEPNLANIAGQMIDPKDYKARKAIEEGSTTQYQK